MIVESIITCPRCGTANAEQMPVNACQIVYSCTGCGAVLRGRWISRSTEGRRGCSKPVRGPRLARSQVWAHAVIAAMRDKAGQLTGFVKLTRDLTERKQMDTSNNRIFGLPACGKGCGWVDWAAV